MNRSSCAAGAVSPLLAGGSAKSDSIAAPQVDDQQACLSRGHGRCPARGPAIWREDSQGRCQDVQRAGPLAPAAGLLLPAKPSGTSAAIQTEFAADILVKAVQQRLQYRLCGWPRASRAGPHSSRACRLALPAGTLVGCTGRLRPGAHMPGPRRSTGGGSSRSPTSPCRRRGRAVRARRRALRSAADRRRPHARSWRVRVPESLLPCARRVCRPPAVVPGPRAGQWRLDGPCRAAVVRLPAG